MASKIHEKPGIEIRLICPECWTPVNILTVKPGQGDTEKADVSILPCIGCGDRLKTPRFYLKRTANEEANVPDQPANG